MNAPHNDPSDRDDEAMEDQCQRAYQAHLSFCVELMMVIVFYVAIYCTGLADLNETLTLKVLVLPTLVPLPHYTVIPLYGHPTANERPPPATHYEYHLPPNLPLTHPPTNFTPKSCFTPN